MTAAAPALWNHEGNQNDAIYGLAGNMPLAGSFGYHSPWKHKWRISGRRKTACTRTCMHLFNAWGNAVSASGVLLRRKVAAERLSSKKAVDKRFEEG